MAEWHLLKLALRFGPPVSVIQQLVLGVLFRSLQAQRRNGGSRGAAIGPEGACGGVEGNREGRKPRRKTTPRLGYGQP